MKNSPDNLKWPKLWAAVWSDDALKHRLMSDPHKVLGEFGINVPNHTKINVLENTQNNVTLLIPPKPADQLSMEELDKVAGGITQISRST
jgi:hypothetical protein